jgi:hypothetical protein
MVNGFTLAKFLSPASKELFGGGLLGSIISCLCVAALIAPLL